MSLLRRELFSALASTILESPLHRTKVTCTIFFCAICQTALPDSSFDTRIHIGKFSQFPIWQKQLSHCGAVGSMSLPRPAAGGESCKQDSFLPYRKVLRISHMVKSNNRTAAEVEYVAVAPRRRRRILQAGFFFRGVLWSEKWL